jgi:hypothetical protein
MGAKLMTLAECRLSTVDWRLLVAKKKEQLVIGRRKIGVSNLDRVFYPGGRFTKGQVIDYYIRVAKYLLRHLKNRPVTLKRFPEERFVIFRLWSLACKYPAPLLGSCRYQCRERSDRTTGT